MPTQLLIYENAVPVSSARHGAHSVEVGGDYAFSRHVNAVPLMAVEFPAAAAEYAIVFTSQDDVVIPAAMLGLRGKENLYLNEQGAWQAKYIPAFIRRYPFVFSTSRDGQTFTLCIDEAYAGVNAEGRGERLFGADGQPTAYVDDVLNFLRGYQSQFQRTQTFCQKLKDLGLLEPMQAQVALTGGGRLSLTGFLAVNRQKLKDLSADKLAELVKADELELIYMHLQSMRNFTNMRNRMFPASEADASTEARQDSPAAGGAKRGNGVAEQAAGE
ncbi:MAG: SapC family protein [Rhodocyclaceae bacterium]|nr:SapC family protein [Rhodocyclaceae bacterium]